MAQQVEEDVLDPVCGMTISPADSVGEIEHRGHTYYFCNQSCLDRFKANPEEFVGPGEASRQISAAADPEAEYTCPMHPEIRQIGPGSCPICGMALEPVNISLDEQPNEELDDMTRRLRWSIALTLPILLSHGRRVSAGTADPCANQRPRPELDGARLSRRRSCCGADGRSSRGAGRPS